MKLFDLLLTIFLLDIPPLKAAARTFMMLTANFKTP
jgi:hypothetical protein